MAALEGLHLKISQVCLMKPLGHGIASTSCVTLQQQWFRALQNDLRLTQSVKLSQIRYWRSRNSTSSLQECGKEETSKPREQHALRKCMHQCSHACAVLHSLLSLICEDSQNWNVAPWRMSPAGAFMFKLVESVTYGESLMFRACSLTGRFYFIHIPFTQHISC